ncbi:MAG: hypothetical protein QXR45_07965 [Candidatus Bathyarchaeia archaeon]
MRTSYAYLTTSAAPGAATSIAVKWSSRDFPMPVTMFGGCSNYSLAQPINTYPSSRRVADVYRGFSWS